MESNMALWERATHYARNLVAATRAGPALDPAARQQLIAALDGELQTISSLATIISGRAANGSRPGTIQDPEYLLGLVHDSRGGGQDPRAQQWRALSQLAGTLGQLATNLSRPLGDR
jgi:hypothetical protein